ncbi:MAG: hypothetical protein ACREQV_01190, partial [Candidatus Binatia bacterium]
ITRRSFMGFDRWPQPIALAVVGYVRIRIEWVTIPRMIHLHDFSMSCSRHPNSHENDLQHEFT